MLLKYSQAQKRMKLLGSGKPQRATGMMKLTSTMMNVVPRIHRKVIKNVASKRPSSMHHHHHHHRVPTASKRHELRPIAAVPVDPCDNSNDSGLGFDHHVDYSHTTQRPALRFSEQEQICWSEEVPEPKRRRLDIKLESDDANDNFTFLESVQQRNPAPLALCVAGGRSSTQAPQPLTLTSQLSSATRDGRVLLQIICQPEQQHRARYQTEGSRGAVKDRSGNGFPVVKLVGYDKPATVQVFIGTDQGRVAPHMFYQACRVSGKNSTPCVEKKVDGTVLIEVDAEPAKDMIITCDCVGILKERNVDVEHRFPDEGSSRSKKKSTRCRMVFRTTISHPDGSVETLQATSQPIVCTQPPGVPEICKKSLTSCPASGGLELFILGKNFLKDTKVVLQEGEGGSDWEKVVQPDKEFLQQSHLVCTVPPYKRENTTVPVQVRLSVVSSGKSSEPQVFTYTPVVAPSAAAPPPVPANPPLPHPEPPALKPEKCGINPALAQGAENEVHPVMLWPSPLASSTTAPPTGVGGRTDMMPPPPLIPLCVRRPSMQMIVPEQISQEDLKRETDSPPPAALSVPEPPPPVVGGGLVADLSSTQPPSMATLRQFVTDQTGGGAPLPSISVENYLSRLENTSALYPQKQQQVLNVLAGPAPGVAHPNGQIMSAVQPAAPSVVIKSQPPTYDERPLLTSAVTSVAPLLMEPPPTSYSQRSESTVANSNVAAQCLNEIISPRSDSVELQRPALASGPQGIRLTELVTASLIAANSTERLDDFVNSAADSHISPGSSPVMSSATSVLIAPIAIAAESTSQTAGRQVSNTAAAAAQEAQQIAVPMGLQEAACPTSTIAEASLQSLLAGPMCSLNAAQQAVMSRTIQLVTQSAESEMLSNSVNITQPNLLMTSTQPQSFSASSALVSPQRQTFTTPSALTSPQQMAFTTPALASPQQQAFSTHSALACAQQQTFAASSALTSPQQQAFTTSPAMTPPQQQAFTAPPTLTSPQQQTFSTPSTLTSPQHQTFTAPPTLTLTSPQQQVFTSPTLSSPQQQAFATPTLMSSQQQVFSTPSTLACSQQQAFAVPSTLTSPQQQVFMTSPTLTSRHQQAFTTSLTLTSSPQQVFTSPTLQPTLQDEVVSVKAEVKEQLALMQEMESISSAECPMVEPLHRPALPVHEAVAAASMAQGSPLQFSAAQPALPASGSVTAASADAQAPAAAAQNGAPCVKKEEGIPLANGQIQELTQMSENDLLSYINPSCFDTV